MEKTIEAPGTIITEVRVSIYIYIYTYIYIYIYIVRDAM